MLGQGERNGVGQMTSQTNAARMMDYGLGVCAREEGWRSGGCVITDAVEDENSNSLGNA